MEFIQTIKGEVTPKYEKTSLRLVKFGEMRQHYWTDSMDGPDKIFYHPPTSTQEMHHARTDCRRSLVGRTGFATCRRIDSACNAD